MRYLTMLLFLIVVLQTSLANAYWSQNEMDWQSVPRVVFGPGGESEIVSRLDREPFITLYKRVFSRANQGYDLDNHDKFREQGKANIAKAAAFIYAINKTVDNSGNIVDFATEDDRLAYGQKAEFLLTNMLTESRMTSFVNMVLDIHTAQELQLWATAYDILNGAGYPYENKELVKENVIDLAADFYKDWVDDQFPAVNSLNNNHMVKSAAALGVAAIALNGYEGYIAEEDPEGFRKPENWIDLAVVLCDRIMLDAQVPIDGGYGEGAGYLFYSAINHLPFFRAMHRYVGEKGYKLDGFEYGDLLFRRDHELIHDWMVKTIMPDGTFPPIDDNSPGTQYSFAEVLDFPNAGVYRWAWDFQRVQYFSSGSVDQSVESLVYYDEDVTPLSPVDLGWNKNQFMYDAGISIFRSDWEDRNAVYLYMVSEHGIAKGTPVTREGNELQGAGGHDHNDPNVIHLYAYGSPLLLDPGYLGWEDHSMVYDADNHNLILVDNKGPELFQMVLPMLVQDENGEWVVKEGEEGGYVPGSDGDAFLRDHFDVSNLSYSRSDTEYFSKAPESIWSRHVLFVHEKYFIVFDDMKYLDGESHTAGLLWHGNGGGDSGGDFEQLEDGAKWEYADAKVNVKVFSPGNEITFTTEENYHDPGNRRALTHTVLRSSVDSDEGVSFISFLLPEPKANENLFVTDMDDGKWYRINDADFTSDENYIEGFAAAKDISALTACNGFTARAKGLFCVSYMENLQRFALIEGTELKDSKNETLFSSDVPVRIFAEWMFTDNLSTTLIGNIDLLDNQSATVKFKRPEDSPVTFASGVCSAEVTEDGMLTLTFHKSGDFTIEITPQVKAASIYPHAVLSADSILVEMGDTVTIDPLRSCSQSKGLSYQYKLVEKPEFSQSYIKSNNDKTISITTDYYGVYIVELTVSENMLNDTHRIRIETLPQVIEDEEVEVEFEGDEDYEEESMIDGDEDLPEMEPEIELEEETFEEEDEVMPEDGDEETVIVDGDEETVKMNISGGCQNGGNASILLLAALLMLMLRRNKKAA